MKRLVIAVAVLALAGCGGEAVVPEGQGAHGHGASSAAPPVPAASARFNDADVMFVQMMVDHLQLGISLSQVGLAKATTQEAKDLAGAIDVTQREELTMLKSWLKLWGKPEGDGANLHTAHGGQPLLDDKVIDETKEKSGTEFDQLFLNLMTGHQGAGVEMALTEKKDGMNPETTAYAERVVNTRQGQISQMLKIIGGA
ncbi:DUF305 domain-containing protein [Lentzea flaviverrucosa]|uniref:Uncharacterized conserved protein, DUF305 family n=1 Tax=Lentzea flaviverrucosa TaxID=200379 RepID=A0A1H9RVY2_9PSEU|nr:DUF305 domain-containing protein [Lentzea flaviverrucosa]RDI33164.1 uncharacterized protein (DUF305 family) [Lentzea flaviverrucosa]SER76807.1 Uncharacterized conserved protein, DUF305 family [Lentzea flaviverrucosa]